MNRARHLGCFLAMLLVSALVLAACGATANDAEHAITDHSKLAEPACDEFDRDFDEVTYECSAAQGSGNRIKLMVYLKSGDVQLIIAWPCVSADSKWRAIRRHPMLRCGKAIWSS